MFMTRISFAVLAGGLLVGGAVAVAQQSGRRPQAPTSRPANVRAVAPKAIPSDEPADGQADLAKEMASLELGLLEDEVKLLRTQVADALKAKVEYETGISRVDPRAGEEAQDAYEKARKVYLEKARDLAKARRRAGKAEEPKKAEPGAPGDDRSADRKGSGTGSHSSGATVGSIDLDAVLKRYVKVRRMQEQLHAVNEDYNERLAKLVSESRAIQTEMTRFAPGSPDHRGLKDQLATKNKEIDRWREGFEKDFRRRQAREEAGLFAGIQEVVATVAEAKGLDYVVKVEARVEPDADPIEVSTAAKRSVLYANPRNDITEEVIRELNRRFEAR